MKLLNQLHRTLLIFPILSLLLADTPDWQDDPAAYEFTATVSGGIVLNNTEQLGGDGDMLAAFDDIGNVRGVGILLFPPFGPYQGTPVFEMQLRSNAAGDLIHYKFYDASQDEVLDIVETYEFVINDIIGSVVQPIEFNIGSSTPPCEDDDSLVSPFTCASALANFGCDFTWGDTTIGEACPETCGTCPVYGCTDISACNYNSDATDDDGSCEENDCAGECGGSAELDQCGVCGGDGPADNFDCDGNCVAEIDCLGNCGGSAYEVTLCEDCLLYTSPSPRDRQKSRMPSSA